MENKIKEMFGHHHGLDEKSMLFLAKALEKSNLPGFDYIEYKQSLGALQKMNIDEATAFKSAYATAATVGLTKEKLLKTAEHYKQVLSSERQKFDDAAEKQIHQKVKSKQAEVEKLKKLIVDYDAKIKELQEKMKSAQATIDQASAQISGEKEKIESRKAEFEHTWQSILNEINKDIENVNKYL